MDCNTAREALSATLDGEDPGRIADTEVSAHLRHCGECPDWVEAATRLDRQVRVMPAPEPTRDPTDAVLAAVTLPHLGRRIRILQLALVVVAIAQIMIGVLGMQGILDAALHISAHMGHELVAFNVAFGVVLLVVAVRIDSARVQVPVLATFVGLLAVISIWDLVSGEVGWARLATHTPIVLGLLLAVYAARMPVAPTGPVGPVPTSGNTELRHILDTVDDRPSESPSSPLTPPLTSRMEERHTA